MQSGASKYQKRGGKEAKLQGDDVVDEEHSLILPT